MQSFYITKNDALKMRKLNTRKKLIKFASEFIIEKLYAFIFSQKY